MASLLDITEETPLDPVKFNSIFPILYFILHTPY